jgi:uncharacterized protein (DUF2384 family)
MIEQFIDKYIEHMKTVKPNTSYINDGIAFKLANNILEKWGCSANEKRVILDLTKSSYRRFQQGNESEELSTDQFKRISYLANIHQSLRLIFSNKENVYGFMSMKNDNPYFSARPPISIISNGRIDTLQEVFKQINSMINV